MPTQKKTATEPEAPAAEVDVSTNGHVPEGLDAEALKDWVDDGWKERARQIIDAEQAKPVEERDLVLVGELNAALVGLPTATENPPPQEGRDEHGNFISPTVAAREREMFEAEMMAYSNQGE